MNYKERLREYIENDEIYTEYKSGKCDMSDFDKFCIEHWKDIECLLNEVQKQKEVIDKAVEYINEYAWKEDIIGDIYTVTGKPMVDKYMQLEWDNCKELLGILSEVE